MAPLRPLLPLLLAMMRSGEAQDADGESPAPAPQGYSAPGETRGCFHYGYAYTGFLVGHASHSDNVGDCQAKCKDHPGCLGFSWWTAPKFECDLRAPGTWLQPTNDASGAAISGPPECPARPPACSDLPGSGFPGPTPALSAAAWPSGEVPSHNQCWPRNALGFPVPCARQDITVLEDTEDGWPGLCEGLKKVELSPAQTCEQTCRDNIFCSVWQEVVVTVHPECWQGSVGLNCYKNRPGFKPLRAQRLMHGTYRVLKDLANIQVMGLTNIFANEVFHDGRRIAAPHCRLYCLSNLGCDYWLYSNVSGCWIEDSTHHLVPYPLVQEEVDYTEPDEVDFASTVISGEYIQHFCGGNTVSAGVEARHEADRKPIKPTQAPTWAPPTPSPTEAEAAAETDADGGYEPPEWEVTVDPEEEAGAARAARGLAMPLVVVLIVLLLAVSYVCAKMRRSARRRRAKKQPSETQAPAAEPPAAEAGDGEQHEQQPLLQGA